MIDQLLDSDLLPDGVLRMSIRQVVAGRLRDQEAGGSEQQAARLRALIERLRHEPIAVSAETANAQHYELPAAFFERVLGPRLKYSSAWWPAGVETLAAAEDEMLALTTERARIEDGHEVLELGCGWGSLTLYLGARFPASRIVGLSNSASQRQYILAKARAAGLDNVDVVTADINHYDTTHHFDRIVSVEMLEHVRNHARLFARLRRWLTADGRFFVHVFSHRQFAYLFEAAGASDWMARHFFTGGMMPSDDFFFHLQQDLVVDAHWRFDGSHYQRTAEAWLANFDRNQAAIERILAGVYGPSEVRRWRVRWRVFFMACAEMFGCRRGEEWGVSHYLFRRRDA
jgi:cyclopropane-fatty-acyl-phospholipid synthase